MAGPAGARPGRVKRAFYFLARPVPAALVFNGVLLLTHAPGVVNLSVENTLVHYLIHTALVFTAFLLWVPVVGPLPELRISYPLQMLYLFVTSIIPTVPAGWLTFAEGAIYSAYDVPDRLWGLTITDDQQMAGVIMKLVGGGFLWVIITMRFFQWAAEVQRQRQGGRPGRPAHRPHVGGRRARVRPPPAGPGTAAGADAPRPRPRTAAPPAAAPCRRGPDNPEPRPDGRPGGFTSSG